MPEDDAGMVHRSGLVLAVIDIQEKLAAAMERRAEVVAATARLVRVAGVLHTPVVVTRQYPAGLGESVPEISAAVDDARDQTAVTIIDKTAFCACDEALFVEAIEAAARGQAVLAGVETHICVTQTALSLHARGFEVFVVADACCSRRAADHEVALDRLRCSGVTVTTSESVIYEAVGRAGTDEFRQVLGIVKGDETGRERPVDQGKEPQCSPT